ncbi:MAG: response regulator [Chloroflexota bacterium]
MKRNPNVLLVEDKPEFASSIQRWLNGANCDVVYVDNKQDALKALDTIHFHLAIFDVRLDDADDGNQEGMDLVQHVHDNGLNKYMGIIVLTAHGTVDNMLVSFNRYRTDRFIPKEPGYRKELMKAVDEIIAERIRVNFDIDFQLEDPDIFDKIVADVTWSDDQKPNSELLLSQLKDALGRLFPRVSELNIEKMNQGLSGASVVMAYPRAGHRMMRASVLKINRRDKVELEEQNYDDHVDPFLPTDRRAKLDGCEYSHHLGVLSYSFAQFDWEALKEFEEIYAAHKADEIINGIENLFRITCYHWYDSYEVDRESIKKLYFEAFDLTEEQLLSRFRQVLPDYSFDDDYIQLLSYDEPLPNPCLCLKELSRPMTVRKCITHGDFNCRNIMVDQGNRYWLIDFYRTYESHILRDFVVLETDIVYRLMEKPSHDQFHLFVKTLLDRMDGGFSQHGPFEFSDKSLIKGAKIILSLRHLGMEICGGMQPRKEYLMSLLMATLNVVRLKHIPTERKEQAIISASMICQHLGM